MKKYCEKCGGRLNLFYSFNSFNMKTGKKRFELRGSCPNSRGIREFIRNFSILYKSHTENIIIFDPHNEDGLLTFLTNEDKIIKGIPIKKE